jgi:hypothetical protein
MADDVTMWRTGDGREIPITEMADQHLRNAIAQIERQASGEHRQVIEYGRERLRLCRGVFARQVVLRGLQAVMEQVPDPSGVNSKYGALIAERERRVKEGVQSDEEYERWWD